MSNKDKMGRFSPRLSLLQGNHHPNPTTISTKRNIQFFFYFLLSLKKKPHHRIFWYLNISPGKPFNLCVSYLCGCLQLLQYLLACDHLCQLGYETSLVEEALEMFQNCETKVKHRQPLNCVPITYWRLIL